MLMHIENNEDQHGGIPSRGILALSWKYPPPDPPNQRTAWDKSKLACYVCIASEDGALVHHTCRNIGRPWPALRQKQSNSSHPWFLKVIVTSVSPSLGLRFWFWSTISFQSCAPTEKHSHTFNTSDTEPQWALMWFFCICAAQSVSRSLYKSVPYNIHYIVNLKQNMRRHAFQISESSDI